MIKNKRAQVGKTILLISSMFLLFLVFMGVFTLASIASIKKHVKDQQHILEDLSNEDELSTYLSSKVTEEFTFGELTAYYIYLEDKGDSKAKAQKDIIESKTKDFFGEEKCFELIVDGKRIIKNKGKDCKFKNSYIKLGIPYYFSIKNELVEVVLRT